MNIIYLSLSWFFGIIYLISSIASISDAPLASLFSFGVALLLLPPIRVFIFSKTNKKISFRNRIAIILLFSFISGMFLSRAEMKKEEIEHAKQEKAQAIAQARITQARIAQAIERKKQTIIYFNKNRKKILKDIKNKLSKKDYQSAFKLAHKYSITRDEELKKFYSIASKRLAQKRKQELEREKAEKWIISNNTIQNKKLFHGYFSNIATEDSNLNVRLIINKSNDVKIILYEYAGNNPVKTNYTLDYIVYIDGDNVNANNSNDKIDKTYYLALHASNYGYWLSFNKKDSKKIHKLLMMGGKLSFYIKEVDTVTSYSFTIQNTVLYKDTYNFFKSKK